MPRIRSIKPGYNKSLDIQPLSIPCRYHFALLWTYADDAGRGIDDPLSIKGELWPLDREVDEDVIEAWQDELAAHGRIVRYESDGRRYFEVVNFTEHQRPNKPQGSKYPGRDAANAVPVAGTYRSGSAPVVLPERSRTATEPLPAVVESRGGEQEQGKRSLTSDDRARLLREAVDLLLLRDGTTGRSNGKENPSGWLNAARKGRRDDHWQAGNAALAENPALTASELADLLEPNSVTRKPEEYVAGQQTSDFDTAKAGVASIRDGLRAVNGGAA